MVKSAIQHISQAPHVLITWTDIKKKPLIPTSAVNHFVIISIFATFYCTKREKICIKSLFNKTSLEHFNICENTEVNGISNRSP